MSGGVTVHIERLVLDGVPLNAAQKAQLYAAVTEELGRLLADGSTINSRAEPNVRAPAISVAPQVNAVALGRDIARTVHACMKERAG